jgi:CubicO group peptidase (beta-lactamase class C family)
VTTLNRCVLPLACLAALAGPLSAAEETSARIDALLAPSAGGKLPGAAVLVLRDGAVVHSKAYGLANIEESVANTSRTKFRLASVSKSFTALVILQLVEQGRVHLEDPLEKYLPGIAGGDVMTINHLLSHTSGMPDFMSFEEAAKLPRDSAPGERLNYSNLGYQALGRVVEKVTGKDYDAQLREAILDPLGMKDTGGGWPGASSEGRATGYLFDPASGGVSLAETSNADLASGGLYSTAEDMARWVKALVDGRIVSLATLEKAWTPVALSDGRHGAYGYGFMLAPYRGLREVAHGGDISGFNTYYAIYPTEKLAVVVLSNVGMRPPGPVPEAGTIAHDVADLLVGDRLGPRWPPTVALAPQVLDRYAGRYRIDAPPPIVAVMGDAIEIRREGERLIAKGKQGEAEIFPETETEFHSKAGPVRITFVLGEGGVPAQAIVTLMGLREFHITRLPQPEAKPTP